MSFWSTGLLCCLPVMSIDKEYVGMAYPLREIAIIASTSGVVDIIVIDIWYPESFAWRLFQNHLDIIHILCKMVFTTNNAMIITCCRLQPRTEALLKELASSGVDNKETLVKTWGTEKTCKSLLISLSSKQI